MNYTRYSAQSGLTDSDIIDMRMAFRNSNVTENDLADMYGIDRTTAARIIKERTWTHVPEPKTLGNYVVYPDGRIYSKTAGRFMQTYTNHGTSFVEISVNGKRQKVSVASLVAKAFLGTKSKNIGFANGNKSDVHFTNLVVSK